MKDADNLKDAAYKYLKEKILNCVYLPGESLIEKDLVSEIGIGRTPVREALLALERESLVVIYPRKGTFVSELTPDGIAEVYQMRKIIEPTAAIIYKKQLDSIRLYDYISRFERIAGQTGFESDIAFYNLDIEFHRYLVAASGNSRLIKVCDDILQTIYRIGIYNTLQHHSNSKEETYKEHTALIEAIIAEDNELIQSAYTYHINHSLIASLKSLNSAPSAREPASAG